MHWGWAAKLFFLCYWAGDLSGRSSPACIVQGGKPGPKENP